MYTHTAPITHKKLPIIQREAVPFSKGSHYSIPWQNYLKGTHLLTPCFGQSCYKKTLK